MSHLRKQKRFFAGQIAAYINQHYSLSRAPSKMLVSEVLKQTMVMCNRQPFAMLYGVGEGLNNSRICEWSALYAMSVQAAENKKLAFARRCSVLSDTEVRYAYAKMRCSHRATPKRIKKKTLNYFASWLAHPSHLVLPRFVACC